MRSPILRMCDRSPRSDRANPEYLRDFYPIKNVRLLDDGGIRVLDDGN